MKLIKLITITAIFLTASCAKKEKETTNTQSPAPIQGPSLQQIDYCIWLFSGYLITDYSRAAIMDCVQR